MTNEQHKRLAIIELLAWQSGFTITDTYDWECVHDRTQIDAEDAVREYVEKASAPHGRYYAVSAIT